VIVEALEASLICHVEPSEISLFTGWQARLQKNDQRFVAFAQNDKARMRRLNVSTVRRFNVRECIDFAHAAD
jgi:hypothetical protein